MVERAANGLANSRSTLITGIPASIALVATSVIAAPSKGSRTMASTPSLMKVSTWLICRFTSLVPSATTRSTSPSDSASATADLVIEPIQPWSAAGAEKPILILSPVAAAEAAAADPPPALVSAAADVAAAADVELEDELEELVHADSTRAAAPTTVMVRSIGSVRRDVVRGGWEAVRARDRRDMWCS